jgi:hypothetical protein
VNKSKELYGNHFLVYNVHSLIHLAQESALHGSLENCAAWKFESYMQKIKSMVRSGHNPCAQIVKRVLEQQRIVVWEEKGRELTSKFPNNFHQTATGKYCEIVQKSKDNLYLCRVYQQAKSAFNYPCGSQMLGIASVRFIDSDMTYLSAEDIGLKCMVVDQGRQRIFLPLLHQA